jgi:N-acetyl-alpha-D-glucosaminyl L-malate synthase BshA
MSEAHAGSLRIGITCYPTYGGSGAVAIDLAASLANRGHEVHVISYGTPFRMETSGKLLLHEVAVPTYPLFKFPPYDMALASKMAEVAGNHHLQVLHAHYAIPHSMAAYLAREILGDPSLSVVTTLHGTDITLVGSDPSYRPATHFALQRSDAVTAVSEYLARETHQTICSDCEIRVIPNFVDPVRHAPRGRLEIRHGYAEDHEPLLMHISNFRPVKRVCDVLRIFHHVYRDHAARLVMIGDGPDRPAAERLARELELHRRVTFTGALPDAALLLSQADAFILPSDGESFGLAALEAMACGVPVVGARAGGLVEVVRDGEEGILEPVGAVEAMGRRLGALLSDREGHERMRRNSRRRVESKYRTDLVVPLYEELYQETIARRRGARTIAASDR